MSKKEKTAKSYAQECYPYSEEMRMQCEQHYEAGWDKALKSQWVSVKERMPYLGQKVLVLTSNKKVVVSFRYILKDCCGNLLRGAEWNGSRALGDSIIAWMPIPSFDDILAGNKDVLKRLKEK